MTHGIVQVSPRQRSERTVQLTLALTRPTLIFAMVKHLISAIYFGISCALYLMTTSEDLKAVETYLPNLVGFLMGCFSLMHCRGFIWTLRQHHHNYSIGFQRQWKCSIVSEAFQIGCFHFFDVLCQSYQAFRMSYYLIDRFEAFLYAFLVSLYCLLTPWFLFATHEFLRKSLVIIIDSCLGFILSTAFPLWIIFSRALRIVVFDRSLQNDSKAVTQSVLVMRYFVVSSGLDLVTRIMIQYSSYLSLRRMVHSLRVTRVTPSPTRFAIDTNTRLADNFRLSFRTRGRLLIYLWCNLLWGTGILFSAFVADWLRHDCPDTCVYSVAPWFDQSCQCVHLELNCFLRDIEGLTVDRFLDTENIGTRMFIIDIYRCAIPSGISPQVLAPFDKLYGLYIIFSNMSTWQADPDCPLPDSLTALHIRHSNLSCVPDILKRSVPMNLIYLRLEYSPISVIPDAVFDMWRNVSSISISNLQLTNLSLKIATFHNLVTLEVRGNQFTDIPLKWQTLISKLPALTTIDLSENQLVRGPWDLIRAGRLIELSSNPISVIPSTLDAAWITTRMVIIDDTPYCLYDKSSGCQSKCSSLCQAIWIGNHRCDLGCFNDACQYDGGDCDSFGYQRQVTSNL